MFGKSRQLTIWQRVLILLGVLAPLFCGLWFIPFPPPVPTPTRTPVPFVPATPTVDRVATQVSLQQTAVAPLPSFCHLTNQTVTLQKRPVNNTHTRLRLLAPTAVAANGEWSASVVELVNAIRELRLTNGIIEHKFRLVLQWHDPVKHLVWSPDGRYLALVTRQEESYVTDLYDIAGHHWPEINRYHYDEREEMPLVWSPDGRYLYFASRAHQFTQLHRYEPATAQLIDVPEFGHFLWPPLYAQSGTKMVANLQRVGNKELVLMEPDGRNARTLLANVELVETIYWLRNHRELALVLGEENGRHIIILDTETGEQRTIVDNLHDISAFRYWPQADLITFWAEVRSGWGVEMGYFSDSTQAYQFDYGYQADWKSREFWSPDGQTMAMKLGSPGFGEALALVYVDGRLPQILYRNLRGLGDPLWSPDSQYLAFTLLNANAMPQADVILEIRDRNGREISRIDPYSIFGDTHYYLEWLPCQ